MARSMGSAALPSSRLGRSEERTRQLERFRRVSTWGVIPVVLLVALMAFPGSSSLGVASGVGSPAPAAAIHAALATPSATVPATAAVTPSLSTSGEPPGETLGVPASAVPAGFVLPSPIIRFEHDRLKPLHLDRPLHPDGRTGQPGPLRLQPLPGVRVRHHHRLRLRPADRQAAVRRHRPGGEQRADLPDLRLRAEHHDRRAVRMARATSRSSARPAPSPSRSPSPAT